jgi:hypothetical protein
MTVLLARGYSQVVVHRKIELARGVWGIAAAAAPQAVLRRTGGDPRDHRSIVVMRVLGVRQAAQAVLSGVAPTGPVLALGIWVDVAHAVSGIGLSLVRHRYARPALTDAVIAAGWASVGFHDLKNGRRSDDEERRTELARDVLSIVPGGRYLLSQA